MDVNAATERLFKDVLPKMNENTFAIATLNIPNFSNVGRNTHGAATAICRNGDLRGGGMQRSNANINHFSTMAGDACRASATDTGVLARLFPNLEKMAIDARTAQGQAEAAVAGICKDTKVKVDLTYVNQNDIIRPSQLSGFLMQGAQRLNEKCTTAKENTPGA